MATVRSVRSSSFRSPALVLPSSATNVQHPNIDRRRTSISVSLGRRALQAGMAHSIEGYRRRNRRRSAVDNEVRASPERPARGGRERSSSAARRWRVPSTRRHGAATDARAPARAAVTSWCLLSRHSDRAHGGDRGRARVEPLRWLGRRRADDGDGVIVGTIGFSGPAIDIRSVATVGWSDRLADDLGRYGIGAPLLRSAVFASRTLRRYQKGSPEARERTRLQTG